MLLNLVRLEDDVASYLCTVDGDKNDFADDQNWIIFDTYQEAEAVLGKKLVNGEWVEIPKADTPPVKTEAEILRDEVKALSAKLDEQSAIIMQIGMMSSTPPVVPTEPPKPGELPPVDMAAVPDANALKSMMGGTTPPDVP